MNSGIDLSVRKDYSRVSVYVHDEYESSDEMISDALLVMIKPFLEIEEVGNGMKVVTLGVLNTEYKDNTDKYIKYLEETLDGLGVTVHKDVKNEIYLGSKGVDPSAE